MRRTDTPTITRHKRGYLGGTDPYTGHEAGPSGATCRRCNAVYYNKRWYASADDLPERETPVSFPSTILCPGCQRVEENNPEGYVSFSGRFLKEHAEEISNLINRELEKAKGYNPIDQIIEWDKSPNRYEITTTTKKLAQRLGRAVQKAYDGHFEMSRSQKNELYRVHWSREY